MKSLLVYLSFIFISGCQLNQYIELRYTFTTKELQPDIKVAPMAPAVTVKQCKPFLLPKPLVQPQRPSSEAIHNAIDDAALDALIVDYIKALRDYNISDRENIEIEYLKWIDECNE